MSRTRTNPIGKRGVRQLWALWPSSVLSRVYMAASSELCALGCCPSFSLPQVDRDIFSGFLTGSELVSQVFWAPMILGASAIAPLAHGCRRV